MFVIFLKFGDNKQSAPQFMEAHNAWLKSHMDAGDFLLFGSLAPNLGGAILAKNLARDEIEAIINTDPFVIEGVVVSEIHEIDAKGMQEPLVDLLK